MTLSIATVYRDFEVDGISASGPHDPLKADIRDALSRIEGIVGAPTSVTGRQLLEALRDTGNPAGAAQWGIVNNAMDPACGDTQSIQWKIGSPMVTGDSLYTAIASATGWNPTQMAAFVTLALTKTA